MPPRRLLDRLSRALGRICLHVFFRQVEVSGEENVPRDRPLILVGNHTNGLIDPIARRFDSFFKYAKVEGDVVLAHKLNWYLRGQRAEGPWPFEVFLTATRPADRFWLDKEQFIGGDRQSFSAALLRRAASGDDYLCDKS